MRVLVTGSGGFIGQHLCARLRQDPAITLIEHRRGDCNLLIDVLTKAYIQACRPDVVVHLAKPPSDGIQTMAESPYRFAADVLRMDQNVIEACVAEKQRGRVIRFVGMGSVCAYPEYAPQPAHESVLFSGRPESTNAPYGHAKRMQLALLEASGLDAVHLILSNVYGPGDRSGHVIPALTRRIWKAVQENGPVTVWGDPGVRRSFLYIDDAVEAICRFLSTGRGAYNVAPWQETGIGMVVTELRTLLNHGGEITYDPHKPIGDHRRWFDTTRLREATNWAPATPLGDGLAATVNWMIASKEIEK